MTDRASKRDEGVLAIARDSAAKRYEQWKKRDLLSVALETMPKQVNDRSIGLVGEERAGALSKKRLEQKTIEELESKNKETRQNLSYLESMINDLEQRLRQIT